MIEKWWGEDVLGDFITDWNMGLSSCAMAQRYRVHDRSVPTIAERLGLAPRAMRRANPMSEAKRRLCLRCRRDFLSTSFGHRVCMPCTIANSRVSVFAL